MAKRFTREEVASKDAKKSTVFVIENKVYDVTEFLNEHPGGHEVLVAVAGRDASEDFEDVGHSRDAMELMAKYQVGELVEADIVTRKKRVVSWDESKTDVDTSGFVSSWKFPLLLGVIATLLYTYLFG